MRRQEIRSRIAQGAPGLRHGDSAAIAATLNEEFQDAEALVFSGFDEINYTPRTPEFGADEINCTPRTRSSGRSPLSAVQARRATSKIPS